MTCSFSLLLGQIPLHLMSSTTSWWLELTSTPLKLGLITFSISWPLILMLCVHFNNVLIYHISVVWINLNASWLLLLTSMALRDSTPIWCVHSINALIYDIFKTFLLPVGIVWCSCFAAWIIQFILSSLRWFILLSLLQEFFLSFVTFHSFSSMHLPSSSCFDTPDMSIHLLGCLFIHFDHLLTCSDVFYRFFNMSSLSSTCSNI